MKLTKITLTASTCFLFALSAVYGEMSEEPVLKTGSSKEKMADAIFSTYAEKRERLIRDYIIRAGIKDSLVIESMLTVPREKFVPDNLKKRAYENEPLPIGYGQTISQPYVVALMTELLKVGSEDKVLEIGTGSGYQAAVLSRIVRNVYTIEIIEPLALRAIEVLNSLKYNNAYVKIGDGYFGWEEEEPFDAIIVTAAADHIPPPLIKQLKKGGRMCIPVGEPYFPQVLKLVEKDEAGTVRITDVIPVIFVPLVREWKGESSSGEKPP